MLLIVYSMRESYSQQVVYKHGNYSKKEPANAMGPYPKGTQPHVGSHEEVD